MVQLGKSKVLVFALTGCTLLQADDGLNLFETKVRPLLAQECYACHTKAKVAGLRLDSREDMLKGGVSGPAIVAGNPDASLLVKALRHQGDLQMPKGRKLKSEQIEAVVQWVRLGAPWPEAKVAKAPTGDKFSLTPEQRSFWAFQPLKKAALPAVKDTRAAKNWMDNFILSRLAKEEIQPVGQADKRTLIRRASYDLTGLPPTPEDVEKFVADTSADAFPKLIDRLLASPAYGERWGRHWLDVARYAEDDTRGLAPMGKGHEPYKFAYIHRDWVIRAMNDDMPYDEFVRAQIAADKFDEKVRVKMLPALGFLGQGPWYYDLADPPVARADERHERVDVITRGFLGLTVACARCHDHKYDPISMHDYYGIASVVNKTEYHEYAMVPKKIEDAWKEEDKKLKALEKSLGEFSRNASTMLADVLARQASMYMMAAWKITGPDKADIAKVAAEQKLDLEALQRWIRFLAKPPAFYPYLKTWQVMVAKKDSSETDAKKLAEQFQTLILEVAAERAVIKRKNERMLATVPDEDEVKSIPLPNGFKSFFDRHQLELKTLDRERMNLWTDVFQRDLTETDDPMEMDPRRLRPGLLVFRDWGLQRQISPEWRAYIASVKEEIEKRRKAMGQFPFVHGVRDMEEMKDLKVHLRGSPYNLGDTAPARFIEVLSSEKPAPFSKGSGRLELADAIVKHPLTARVMVNRVWKWHFGTGLVDTPSNFGFAGERPTHPELLENLAAFFVENGMSIKKLHREIMLSATYQRAYDHSEAAASKDGGNRLYWRANRQRLDAESIRDSMLSYSGTMEGRMYGPSEELTEKNRRRTVYGKVSRFKLDNYLTLFDFPNPNLTAEKRHSTTVPLQGLFFLNSKFVLNQAEALARRLAIERKDEAKIRQAYRVLFQRPATEAEVRAGLEFIRESAAAPPPEKVISQKPAATCDTMQSAAVAGPMLAKPASPASVDCVPLEAPSAIAVKGPEADKDKQKKAPDAWTTYCKVLLSSNELLYVD